MTNTEIIIKEMAIAGLDPMKDVVNTFAGWKRNGYVVNKGETAAFKTKIWKPCKNKKQEGEEEAQTSLRLVNAAFFTFEQVKAIGA